MRRFLLAIALVVAPMSLARGQSEVGPLTVQSLLRSCSTAEGSAAWLFCSGYIMGVGDVMHVMGVGVGQPEASVLSDEFAICSDTGISELAMIQAFKNWAQAHPEKWTDTQNVGVVDALKTTWPCT